MTEKRNTWQKEAVRSALEGRGEFVSAQKLHGELRDAGSTIGLATVYRALNDLVAQKQADSLLLPSGESMYRACLSGTHHHHLICRICGSTQEISADVIEQWTASVAREFGYRDLDHVVDVFGICPNCA